MKILLTGGSQGLGKDIVKLLDKKGHKVFFTFNSSIQSAKQLEKECSNAESIHCNFLSEESLNSLINNIPSLNISGLINNAVTGLERKHFHKLAKDDLLSSFNNDTLPHILISQACIKVMRKSRFGKIINILSSSITSPPIGFSNYAANKQYLLSMGNSWANENKKFNISVNSISPSFMLTKLNSSYDNRILEEMKNDLPNNTFLEPADVAKSVLFLLESPLHLNKQNIIY